MENTTKLVYKHEGILAIGQLGQLGHGKLLPDLTEWFIGKNEICRLEKD